MRSRLIVLFLLLVLGGLLTPAHAAPPTPTPDPMGMPSGMVMPTPQVATTAIAGQTPTPLANVPTAQVSVFMARVRDLPNINAGSTVLELLAQGQTVQVYKQLADHSWYGVMSPSGGHGWM